MDIEMTAKANQNQNANEMPELSMDDLKRISGGSEYYRSIFIRMLADHKKAGLTKADVQRKYPSALLLEIIDEVWDTL